MRVQADHWVALLDFCDEHPEIITNRFNGLNGRANCIILWGTLTVLLNSLGFGEKSQDEWKKTLTDWKSKTKSKAAKINESQRLTGGGCAIAMQLTSHEERLLKLMGKTAVEGDVTIPEIGMRKRACEFQISPNSQQKRKASCVPVHTAVKLNKQDLAICSGMTPSTSATSNVRPSSFMFDNDGVIASNVRTGAATRGDLPGVHITCKSPIASINPGERVHTTPRGSRQNQASQKFDAMNNQVLEALYEINDNIAEIAGSFKALIVAIEKKK